MAEPITIAAYAALTAISIGAGIHQANRAEDRAEDLAEAESAATNYRAARQRRQQAQQMLLQQGTMANMGAATGTSNTSAAVGGMGQVGAQGAQNISTINSNLAYGQNVTDAQTAYQKAQQPSNFQQVAGGLQSVAGQWMATSSTQAPTE